MVRSAERALPSFRAMRASLPWPTRSTTSADACAAALVDGVERRARRIYVPRSVALIAALRSVLTSGLGERLVLPRAGTLVPQLDAEVTASRRVEAPDAERVT
jgi:hypothetical protein